MPEETITVHLTRDDIQCINSSLAHLWILINEHPKIEVDADTQQRLAKAEKIVDKWSKVLYLRQQLAQAEQAI